MDVRDDGDAHPKRATVSNVAIVLLLAGLWLGSAAFLWRTRVPPLALPDVDPATHFAASDRERIEGFRGVTRALWVATTLLELVLLALLAWRSRRLASHVRRWFRGRVRTGVGVGLVAVVLVWVATLPPGVVSHWWRRRYGLSEQGYPAWLGDRLVSLGVRAVLVALAVAGAVALARRFGRRWWLAGAPALAALGLLFVLVQPLVLQPLFNRFEPLPDRRLAAEIQGLARSLGVQVDRIEVADASRRTTAANAYVAGIGPTRRVVLYDTLLAGRFSRAEIISVSAHELAHVGRRHLWKGAAWFALLVLPGVYLVARVTERGGGLRDPALVPLALLVALAFSLGTLPLQNLASRRYEAEADWLALRATRDSAAAIGLERRLVLSSLSDPDPPGWVRIWLGTHPSPLERIAMALAFRERGIEPSTPPARGGS